VRQGFKVLWVIPVTRVRRAFRDCRGFKGFRVNKVFPVLWELPDRRVPPGFRVYKAFRVNKVNRVNAV
jgi:hypothetical protein